MAPRLCTGSGTSAATEQKSPTDRIMRRRIMKQMVERRRRERIDSCLDNIKTLVLTNLNKNPADYEKMEKADILEMTVNFLMHQVKGQRSSVLARGAPQQHPAGNMGNTVHPNYPQSYAKGYHVGIQQTHRFLENRNLPGDIRARLVGHLETSVAREQKVNNLVKIHSVRDISPNTVKSEQKEAGSNSNGINGQKAVDNKSGSSMWRPW